ncbi:Coenzyme PQQ synthesis protein D (PqqD) [Paenibacillus sp. UNC496MF]|uniref:PqqD family protein n=1 Tax=Paenibacillus sp. UNC496MF TaxID=1502753 RepID=UPI0008E5E4E6|nr:PqqD family protein [Paenibacillus sp. UNC496MF]SFI88845.1 Coenzyme PQQ synthesis protein D (PqqD) [Paenibacillus sp. UNC496MF]
MMNETELSRRALVRNDAQLEVAELDDEWVLMNVDTQVVIKLNGLGGYIWSKLPEYPNVHSLAGQIRLEFEDGGDEVAADVEAFIEDLLAAGLVSYA